MILSIEWDITQHTVDKEKAFFIESKPTLTVIIQPGEDWTPRVAEIRQKLWAVLETIKDNKNADRLNIVKIDKDRRRRTD